MFACNSNWFGKWNNVDARSSHLHTSMNLLLQTYIWRGDKRFAVQAEGQICSTSSLHHHWKSTVKLGTHWCNNPLQGHLRQNTHGKIPVRLLFGTAASLKPDLRRFRFQICLEYHWWTAPVFQAACEAILSADELQHGRVNLPRFAQYFLWDVSGIRIIKWITCQIKSLDQICFVDIHNIAVHNLKT